MAESKTVSTGALLSVSTGLLLCKFDEMHEAIEVLAGQPVFTHQMASERLWRELRAEAARQHPWLERVDMATFPYLEEGLSREDAGRRCDEWVAAISEWAGSEHEITSPAEPRRVPLTEGMPPKFGGDSR